MKLTIELTEKELETAVYNYLIDIYTITDDMKITGFYPFSKVMELTNEINAVGE